MQLLRASSLEILMLSQSISGSLQLISLGEFVISLSSIFILYQYHMFLISYNVLLYVENHCIIFSDIMFFFIFYLHTNTIMCFQYCIILFDNAETEAWFIDSLEEWRKAKNLDRFVLLGHSFGGYIAAKYALKVSF